MLEGDPFAGLESSGCFYCGLPSAVLCDGHLAWFSEDGKTISGKAKQFTCDRRLCRAHVAEHSMIHFNAKPKSFWDSRDFCRDCVKEDRQSGSKILYGRQRRQDLASEVEGLALQARRKFQTSTHPHQETAA